MTGEKGLEGTLRAIKEKMDHRRHLGMVLQELAT